MSLNRLTCVLVLSWVPVLMGAASERTQSPIEFYDSHFHLTNYVQKGTPIEKIVELMGTQVGRSTLFGIPLQQTWAYSVDGKRAPNYYLESDAPLYYYSFTDAFIAQTFLSLPSEQRRRFDPMITGFNPADLYAVDHIRRVLETFPGVFSGIGEFTIHKEFVSSKVAGEKASLTDPALDKIFDFAAETGLLTLIHSDMDTPFPKKGKGPAYLDQMRKLLKRHPGTSTIWAHMGVGRVVRPVYRHVALIEEMLRDPQFNHVNFDISWSEVAKYVVASPKSIQTVANVINRFPDRFLLGTDEVSPTKREDYLKIIAMYQPLFEKLTPNASEKLRKGNYERLFDESRRRVRNWEARNLPQSRKVMAGTAGGP